MCSLVCDTGHTAAASAYRAARHTSCIDRQPPTSFSGPAAPRACLRDTDGTTSGRAPAAPYSADTAPPQDDAASVWRQRRDAAGLSRRRDSGRGFELPSLGTWRTVQTRGVSDKRSWRARAPGDDARHRACAQEQVASTHGRRPRAYGFSGIVCVSLLRPVSFVRRVRVVLDAQQTTSDSRSMTLDSFQAADGYVWDRKRRGQARVTHRGTGPAS